MQNRWFDILFATAILVGMLALIAGCSSPTPTPLPPTAAPQPTTPPQATAKPTVTTAPAAVDGAALLESRCTACHNLDRVKRGGKNKDVWTATVQRMVGKGAKLDAAEQTVLIDYLTKTYP